MKLRRHVAISLLALAAVACSSGGTTEPDALDPRADLERSTGTSWVVVDDPRWGTPSFLEPRQGGPIVLPDGDTPTAAARRFLERYKGVFGMRDPASELADEAESATPDGLGMRHATFTQRVNGVPVLGLRYGLHFDRAGRVAFVSGGYRAGLDALATKPAIGEDVAIAAANADFAARGAPAESARAMLAVDPTGPTLVWRVLVAGKSPISGEEIRVDATTAAIVRVAARVRHAVGHGRGVRAYSFTSRKLVTSKPIDVEPSAAGGFTLSRQASGGAAAIAIVHGPSRALVSAPSAEGPWDATSDVNSGQAVDTMFYTSLVDRYYRERHGWSIGDGIEKWCDAGSCYGAKHGIASDHLVNIVHDADSVDNAGWSPAAGAVAFGDSSNPSSVLSAAGAFDIVAHEWQHAVTSFTIDLADCPKGHDGCQPGAMDESLSDTFGSFEDHYYTAVAPDPEIAREGVNPALHAETVCVPPRSADRHMIRPDWDTDEHGKRGAGIANMRFYSDDIDVHYLAGIPNNAYWIATNGTKNITSGRGIPNAPLGWDNAEKLYWSVVHGRAITGSATFADLARALAASARTLDGGDRADGPVSAVACAWAAVGVLSDEEIASSWGISCNEPNDATPIPDAKDCAVEEAAACDTAFPGQGLVCSANGGDAHCCRAPFAITPDMVCYSNEDCQGGQICALGRRDDAPAAAAGADAGSTASFGCIDPAANPCVR